MRFAAVFVFFFMALSGSALAECYVVKSDGSSETLGQYPYSMAHKACLNDYIRLYRGNKKLGDSKLYLNCDSSGVIAKVTRGRLKVLKTVIDGCT